MSATLNCCNPCATVETVNVPGIPGVDGADGVDGVNAVTHLDGEFVYNPLPNSSNPGVPVLDTSWMAVGQVLLIGDGFPSVGEEHWGHFRVAGIVDATHVNLTYLDYLGDNFSGGGDNTLASGCRVVPAGVSDVYNT